MELPGTNKGSSIHRKGMIQVLPSDGVLTPAMNSLQMQYLNGKARKHSENQSGDVKLKLDLNVTKLKNFPPTVYSSKEVPIQGSTFILPSTWESFDEIPSFEDVAVMSDNVKNESVEFETQNQLTNIHSMNDAEKSQVDGRRTNFQTLHDEIAQMQQELAAINLPMQEHNDWLLHQFEEVKELLQKQKQIERTMDVVKTQNQSIKRKIATGFPVGSSPEPSASQLNLTSPHSPVTSFGTDPKVLVESTKSAPIPPPKPTKKLVFALETNSSELPLAKHGTLKTNPTNNHFPFDEFKQQKIRKAPLSLILPPVDKCRDTDSKEISKPRTSSLRIKPPLSPKPTILTIKVSNQTFSAPRDRIKPITTSNKTQTQPRELQQGSFTDQLELVTTRGRPTTSQNTLPIPLPLCTALNSQSVQVYDITNDGKLDSDLAPTPKTTFKAEPQAISPTNSTSELMEQIRQFSQTGQVLKKIQGSRTTMKMRKNSMQDALQNRFQAFCGTSNSSEESESDTDEQWDD